jgi:chemotaxis protein MotA
MAETETDKPIVTSKGKKDIGTTIGIPMAVAGLLLAYILDHGVIMALMNVPAFFFVIVGTLGVTMASVRFSMFLTMHKLTILAMNPPPLPSSEDLIATIAELADKVRRAGSLAVQGDVKQIDNRFLQAGMNLVVNGVDNDQIRAALEIDTFSMAQRHGKGANMFAVAAGFAPTLGILGTVMGLISVLGNMKDPSTIGPHIATAFIATLYGVGIANIFFFPISNKLKIITQDEIAQREIILEGVLMINANMTPRQIKERLASYLPPVKVSKKVDPNDPFDPAEDE